MRSFACPTCSAVVFFTSATCSSCDGRLAYDVLADHFVANAVLCRASEPAADNASHCNWVSDGNVMSDGWCRSCRLDLDHQGHELEGPFQEAKRRTLRQLTRFGIDPSVGPPALTFDLRPSTNELRVVTGHADGLVTIDIAEADPVTLAEVREELGEPYRTPLGHIRHEVGHWFWAWALGSAFSIEDVRRCFGDERADYSAALADHYARPDDGSWTSSFLSHYASAHPWEDFAESFAHVLHMSDALETAAAHGLIVAMKEPDFDARYTTWADLALALNDLNRSMGTPDPYPFVIPPPAVDKLRFVDAALRSPR